MDVNVYSFALVAVWRSIAFSGLITSTLGAKRSGARVCVLFLSLFPDFPPLSSREERGTRRERDKGKRPDIHTQAKVEAEVRGWVRSLSSTWMAASIRASSAQPTSLSLTP